MWFTQVWEKLCFAEVGRTHSLNQSIKGEWLSETETGLEFVPRQWVGQNRDLFVYWRLIVIAPPTAQGHLRAFNVDWEQEWKFSYIGWGICSVEADSVLGQPSVECVMVYRDGHSHRDNYNYKQDGQAMI